ncbi:fructose-6-phosphate aldolase [Candidatus Woesearchaeota archaeon]|nr:fructose-6-phosphate aldolase [Candidatus Woesearchaeota archaeon]
MEIFADTASLDDLKELLSWGIVAGCTTNPKLCAKEGVDFEKRMKEILQLVKGPVSIEVTTNDSSRMISEAKEYNSWGSNVVVKIPMNVNGLKAVKTLSELGIKTNVTACMAAKQAILAALAGADYVSLFWGRIEDMGYDAKKVAEDAVKLFGESSVKSRIILGSFRQVSQVNAAMLTGAHILTITPPVIRDMVTNPRTTETIQEFLDTWEAFRKGK